jgi:hypothetical protein
MALVTTTKGEMDDSLLEKKEGFVDNDHEYWLAGELVHRSAHVSLKKNVSSAVEAASFN